MSELQVIADREDGKWLLLQDGQVFFLTQVINGEAEVIRTPGGQVVTTTHRGLASRLLNYLGEHGMEYHAPDSILAWHFTYVESFSRMEHGAIEEMLDRCFLQSRDWTYAVTDRGYKWRTLFGDENERIDIIRRWLTACTSMQLTAACCIGNAYASLNLAYVLAKTLELSGGESRFDQIQNIANLIAQVPEFGPYEEIMNTLVLFDFYYGIDLQEKGPTTVTAENVAAAKKMKKFAYIYARLDARLNPDIHDPDRDIRRSINIDSEEMRKEQEHLNEWISTHSTTTFQQDLMDRIQESGMSYIDFYKAAYMDRKLFSAIKNSVNYSPKKETVIACCMALKLNYSEAKLLMSKAGFDLSEGRRWDMIIDFCLHREIYDIDMVNELLYHYGEKIIGG